MIRRGTFVAENLWRRDGSDAQHEQTQPNGVDLRVGEVERIVGNSATFGRDGYNKPDRTRIEPFQRRYDDPGQQTWRLYSGRYAIVYDESIAIPEGHVGRVYPRSRVMRSGLHLTSALWDQGYEGRGEGLLQVPPCLDYVDIEVGASLAQMVFIEADGVDDAYDGSHQGERLE